jgi:DNA repair protein RadA/Sms
VAKAKTVFFCQSCGYESPKWLGKCPSCSSWNSFAEEVVTKQENNKNEWRTESTKTRTVKPRTLEEVESSSERRMSANDNELNRVLGGGIVPGSLVLIGGEPGIGKSTLMLQVGLQLKGTTVLYISGEESEQQIKMRAERLGFTKTDFYVLTETNTKNIFLAIDAVQPGVVVIDSIQTLYSPQLDSTAGSIGQVRQCAGELMKFAKETHTPVFLIGHITKDGMLAGPKVLEHMVDTVLQFEGDEEPLRFYC